MISDFETQIKHARYVNQVYFLGNFEQRITVYNQQIRAVNLIYSLWKQKLLTKNSKVSIIGAGVSGLTAASCAALLGCRSIDIFEQADSILPLWKNSTSRVLHPNLFTWPKPGWQNNISMLPILNWKSDIAKNVAKCLEEQWKIVYNYFKGLIEINLHLNTVATLSNKNTRVNFGDRGKSTDFNIAFIAVGFGMDGYKNDFDTCYWANDNLDAFRIGPTEYFVSGNGDGGIADLLRIRFKDFSYTLVEQWLLNFCGETLQTKINDIEENYQRIYYSEDEEQANQYLINEYEKLDTSSLEKEMSNHLRSGTIATLHSQSDLIYNFKAFPLNRFLLYICMKIDTKSSKFVYGKIENLDALKKANLSSGNIEVILENFGSKKYDEVILRHGPLPAMNKDGMARIKKEVELKTREKNSLDQTGRNPIFYEHDFMGYPELNSALLDVVEKERIALAIIKDHKTNLFLFTKRKIKEGDFQWGFVGKRIRKNSVVQSSLAKECKDETGIDCIPRYKIGERIHPDTAKIVEYWICDFVGGKESIGDREELEDVKWVTAEELIKLGHNIYKEVSDFIQGTTFVSIGVVIKDGLVLLVQRAKKEPGLNWQFPGGKIEFGESPREAAIREVFEETGIKCEIVRDVGYRIHPTTQAKLFYYVCNFISGEIVINKPDEIKDARWVKKEDINSLIPQDIFESVKRYLEID